MKKFYTLMAAAAIAMTASAANFQFYVDGQPVQDGARIDLEPYFETPAGFEQYNPKLTMIPSVSGTATATAAWVHNNTDPRDENWDYGADFGIKFCAFDGSCVTATPDLNPAVTKSAAVTAGETVDMEIELGIDRGFIQEYDDLDIDVEFTVTCALADETQVLTFFVRKYPAGVEGVAVDANAPKCYYDLQGRQVSNPGAGLYIVRQGDKVTKHLLK